jgi:hypothetical protein
MPSESASDEATTVAGVGSGVVVDCLAGVAAEAAVALEREGPPQAVKAEAARQTSSAAQAAPGRR